MQGPLKPVFELTGGRLCLDFANTVDNRGSERRKEQLTGYSDLVEWARLTGTLSSTEGQLMLHRAGRQPHHAELVMARAIPLREAIYRVFSAVAGGRRAVEADLELFNRELHRLGQQVRLRPGNQGFDWEWVGDKDALDRILWPVVRSAADLLRSEELARVRQCASETCGWLFLDTTRNRSRRWCEMKTCGNRNKVRNFYRRERAGI